MAILNLSDLTAILFTNFGKLITEGITQRGGSNDAIPNNSLWGLLAKHNRIVIGYADENATKPMEWGIHTSTLDAVSYGKNDVYTAYTPEGYGTAALEWKRWGTPFGIDALESWALGKGNAGRGGGNEVERAIKQRLRALVNKGNTMLGTDGTGNSSKDVTGLKAFLAASGTYATADLSQSYWLGTHTTVSGAQAKSHYDSTIQGMADKDGLSESLVVVMRRNQLHRFRNLYAAQIEMVPGGQPGDAVQMIWTDGAVNARIEVVDGGMPNDEVWFLNMNDITLYLADQVPNTALGDKSSAETIMHDGIPVGVAPIYENTDNENCWLRVWGQLVCENPRRQGSLLALTA